MEANKEYLRIAYYRAEAQIRIDQIKQRLLDISNNPTDDEILRLVKEWREQRVKIGVLNRELPASFCINPNDD